MNNFEYLCVTGTGSAFGLQPDFSDIGCFDIGSQSALGCLDAPKYMAAGSMLRERWLGIAGQSVIHREQA